MRTECLLGVGVERLPDLFRLCRRCRTVVHRQPVCGSVALRHGRLELLLQVALRVVVFGEDDDPDIRPRSARLTQLGTHVLAYPVQESMDPRIGLPAGGLGDRAHGVEQILLAGEQDRGGRIGRRPERGRGGGFDLAGVYGDEGL